MGHTFHPSIKTWLNQAVLLLAVLALYGIGVRDRGLNETDWPRANY